MSNNKELPKGYRTVDKATIRGRLKDMSPIQKELQALMVRDRQHRSERSIDQAAKPVIGKVKRLSDIISRNIQAANDLRSVTHYIKRAEQIWTTLLLKPNGDQPQLLRYDTKDSDIKNGKLHEMLLQIVENYFTTKYPFEEYIPQIIKDVLFRTGSYALLNLSHSALDHLINGQEVSIINGTENFDKHKPSLERFYQANFAGSLNKAKNFGFVRKTPLPQVEGLEGIYKDNYGSGGEEFHLVEESLNWTFTDNVAVLGVSRLRNQLKAERLARRAGTETLQTVLGNVFSKKAGKVHKETKNNVGVVSKETFDENMARIYPERRFNNTESLSIRKSRFYTGTGRGIGITFHVPSEAVIPVHVNGEVGKPFGYIVLTDPPTGEFLKTSGDPKFYQSTGKATSGLDTQSSFGSVNQMASHIKQIANGNECDVDMEWVVNFASATLEKEIVESFFNGDTGKSVTVTLSEQNKKLYLARSLKQQGVRAVFIPGEYVTYVATDFSHLGVGRSLVEDAKLTITRLAILETANALAQVENAISKTLLTIDLEAENFDPRAVAAMAREMWFAGNPQIHDILGVNNISIDAIVDAFKDQQLQIKINAGDNKHIIAPAIEANQAPREPLKGIDQDTRDTLQNTVAGHFGLKRSWLEDTGDGNDFAIEALADQELLRNQTSSYSKIFSGFFGDFMRKHMYCNEPLITNMVQVITDNKTLYQKPDQGKSLSDIVKVSDSDNEQLGEAEERNEIEMVLVDFLNNLYVELPQPAVIDSLNKITDKLESIDKLVTMWMDLSGGKLIEKRAAEFNLEAEEVKNQVRGMYLHIACKRFNLPTPFDMILNNGDTGGILSLVNDLANFDRNGMKFFEQYLKEHAKNKKGWDKLVKKYETTEDEDQPGSNTEESPGNELDSPGENEPFMDVPLPDDDGVPETDPLTEEEDKQPEEEPDTEPVDEDLPKGEDDLLDQ